MKNRQHAGQLHVTEQRLLTLQLRGELAEDSLDVPSYIAALSSGVIIYAWLSELSNCPAAIARRYRRRGWLAVVESQIACVLSSGGFSRRLLTGFTQRGSLSLGKAVGD